MSPISLERREQFEREVLDRSVRGMAIDASEMADLLLRARHLDELAAWARRAVCFIGATGQGAQADETADQLIFEAHAVLSSIPAEGA